MQISNFITKLVCGNRIQIDNTSQKKFAHKLINVSQCNQGMSLNTHQTRNPLATPSSSAFNELRNNSHIDVNGVTLKSGESYVINDPIVANYPDTLLALSNENGTPVANLVIHGARYKNGYIRFLADEKKSWGANEMAEFIKNNPILDKANVFNLITCLGGKESTGDYILGQQLADKLGKPVITYSEKIRVSENISKISEMSASHSFVTSEPIKVKDKDMQFQVTFFPSNKK